MSLADRRYAQKHKPGKHNRKKFTAPPKPNAQLRKEPAGDTRAAETSPGLRLAHSPRLLRWLSTTASTSSSASLRAGATAK